MQFHERWIECLQALVNIVETMGVSDVCHRDLPMSQEFPAGSSFLRGSIPCVRTYLFYFIPSHCVPTLEIINDKTCKCL